MKTITYFEPDDIKNITNIIGYYFEGEVGFLKKNNLPEYSWGLAVSDTIKAQQIFNETDSKGIHDYICFQQSQRRKRLEKLKEEIRQVIKDIDGSNTVLESFKISDSLTETMSTILKIAEAINSTQNTEKP